MEWDERGSGRGDGIGRERKGEERVREETEWEERGMEREGEEKEEGGTEWEERGNEREMEWEERGMEG